MGGRKGWIAPDSRRARLSRLIARWQRQGKRGFSFAEILSGYRKEYPGDAATHDSLTSTVGALVHAGELARERGAGRKVLYLPQPSPNVATDDSLLARAVVEIVESYYEVHHCPISTAAITAELKRRALWPERFARLHPLLRRLASDGGIEGDGWDLNLPAVQRADARTAIGEHVAFWIPVGEPAQCATEPSSRADALRHVVAAASLGLGRPVSKSELRWCLDAQPGQSPFREMLDPSRLGPHLQHTVERDAPYLPLTSRLRAVDGPLTCHGGPPRRYLHRSPSQEELAACRLEDAVIAIRPATELAGTRKLEARARALRSPTLADVARTRRRLVAHALRAYSGPELRAIARRVSSSYETLARWIDESSISYASRYSRRRELTEAQQELDAVLHRLSAFESTGSHRTTRRTLATAAGATLHVGRAGLVSVKVIRDFAIYASHSGDLDTPRPELAYARARRFPNPALVRRPPADTLVMVDTLAFLDRADAVLAVFSASEPRRAMTLLASAHLVLGEVLRDVTFLQDHLTRSLLETSVVRRPVGLAAALLGECPELKALAPGTDNVEDVRAYVLAALVSDLDAEMVHRRVLECARVARGPARAIARRALHALEAGRLVSILE